MTPHELLLIGVKTSRFHQDPVLDADLADVVEEAGELDLLDLPLGDPELPRDRARDARHAIGVAAGEPVFRVDRLRQCLHRSVEEIARLGVPAERIAREQQRDHE